MLIRCKLLFWSGVALLFVGVAFLILPPYEKYCESNYANDYYCSAYKVPVTLGAWLDLHAGAITALFTIVLGISTILLWKVTAKSAGIAERALTELERAYIFVDKIETNVSRFFSSGLVWRDGEQTPIFRLWAVNFGRTPGNVEFGVILFDVASEMPAQPTRLHTTFSNPAAESVEIIIGPDKTYGFPWMNSLQTFTNADVENIKKGAASLYCYGYLKYFDIFMKSHTTAFCRKYVWARDEWPPEGGKERNYSN
jgi:hypothetical protein